MPANVHFTTFLPVFVATLSYGMEGAQAVCNIRVRAVREERQHVKITVEAYLCHHYKTLLDYKDKVHEVPITAMNVSLQGGMMDLATHGRVMHHMQKYSPPPAGKGVSVAALAFPRLRELVEEGAGFRHAERQIF